MVLEPAAMQALEQRAFAGGVSVEDLMEQAGAGVAAVVRQFFPAPGTCLAVFGKGHNGADALVAARHLAEAGWRVLLVAAFPEEKWAPLCRTKFQAVQALPRLDATGDWPQILQAPTNRTPGHVVVLDGLLGVGASGPLRPPISDLTTRINALRESAYAQVVAIDLPTGLDGDTGEPAPGCIVADFTVTLGFAKRGLLEDSATNHVGRLALVPLPELARFAPETEDADRSVIAHSQELAALLPRRPFESHKGLFGRVNIVAGSRGFTGAALLCSAACVRAGAGLVSLHVPEEVYSIVAASTTPEVMVHPVRSYAEVLEIPCDVLALGPGLGRSRAPEVRELIRTCPHPMVIDADGLNILSEQLDLLTNAPAPRLLTPHPGEMARLDPAFKQRSRLAEATHFTEQHPVTLLLKGSRTIVAERDRPPSYNTTGNAGMATGGMGDLLTGVCAALAGQRLPLYDAARLGAWLCGRAAELALSEGGQSQESLTPIHVLAQLGAAFRSLHARDY